MKKKGRVEGTGELKRKRKRTKKKEERIKEKRGKVGLGPQDNQEFG